MATLPPPLPTNTSSSSMVLTVLLWLGWLGVIVVADFMGFMMFAFADSPGSAKAAKLMIAPMFVWFGVTFVAGILLLIFKGWWQVPLAFVLAISPPFLAFLGYNLLAGVGNITVNTGPPPPPPVRINQTTFAPPPTSMPTQPDFQKMLRDVTTRPNGEN